ncbi:MAG: thioesterase family protein [Chloroflexota bacterium]|nr:thioesterase family protein [Chloroflexota bacterium]
MPVPATRHIVETTLYVRYAETDAMGIVHHANYIVFFEEGRSAYTRQRGSSYAELEKTGVFLTVVEVGARYVKPSVYGQRLTVRCWIAEIRSRGVTFEYEIVDTDTGALSMTGFTKHICVDREGRIILIPALWRIWAE